MNFLLDTHTFLWFLSDDKQLSPKAKKTIEHSGYTKYVSIVSLWEIAIKMNKGKLELAMPFSDLLQQMDSNGFEILPVSFQHTLALCDLEHHHGDPFDRMIIAQSLTQQYILISKDKSFKKYANLQLLW